MAVLLVLADLVLGGQQREELSARAVFQHKVKPFAVLEARDHFHQEGVGDSRQDLLLDRKSVV